MQTLLDFTVHSRENNNESQTYYEANVEHFNRQALQVWEHLKRGESISCDEARELYGIRHLPRRIADIRTQVQVKDERMDNGCKKYFL
jgi:hypothetical protein